MGHTQGTYRESFGRIEEAVAAGLMQNGIAERTASGLRLTSGEDVVDFSNCSYLGLDVEPSVVGAAQAALGRWGVHYCCARSRLTIEENRTLEAELGAFFGGTVITFPSVTSAHMSALPLLASGLLLQAESRARPVRVVFDRFAHASMQFLRPLLAAEATVRVIPHNDLDALVAEIDAADEAGERCAYVADGVYSMGTTAPVRELLAIAKERNVLLYLDDAHGTSVFGPRGEGLVAAELRGGAWPSSLAVTFSLAKGFGCNGGGIILPSESEAAKVRALGMTFAFSGPLDFAIVGAARASLAIHRTPRWSELRSRLLDNIACFDEAVAADRTLPLSPIRMVRVGDEDRAIAIGKRLLEAGFYVPVAFYPVVPRRSAQLRVCITARHTPAQIRALVRTIHELLEEPTHVHTSPTTTTLHAVG